MISRDIQKVPEGKNELRIFLRKILRDHYRDIRDILIGEVVLENLLVDGKVGIGTTSPGAKLQINDKSHFMWMYETDGDVNERMYSLSGNTSQLEINARQDDGAFVRKILVLKHNGNVGVGAQTPNYPLQVNGGISGLEKSADPAEPAEGEYVIWMSDGTGKGDDGDVLIASKAGGTTKYTTLFDHSAGDAW